MSDPVDDIAPEDQIIHTPETTADSAAGDVKAAEGSQDLHMGRKERRKSSAYKPFGQNIPDLEENKNIKKIMSKHGDSTIVFSGEMMKVNRRNKMQKRVLVITDTALYNLDPSNYKVKRRIPINLIGGISLSTLSDNFFAVHVPTEYDYLLVSAKKTEVLFVLKEEYKKIHNKELEVEYGDRFDYRIDSNTLREIHFAKVPGGVHTQIFTKPKS